MFKNVYEKIVVGIISAIALGAIYAAWEAVKRSSVEIFIPNTAVVAFDASTCPEGWSAYRDANGRFIIGTGTNPINDENGETLIVHELGDTGGHLNSSLSEDNIPSHNHSSGVFNSILTADGAGTVVDTKRHGGSRANLVRRGELSDFGNSEPTPFSNVPPYVALTYCVKK